MSAFVMCVFNVYIM